MKNNIIMFGSVTLAMKSRDLLKNHGISSKLIRTPMQFRNRSCGYSLVVSANDKEYAIDLISHNRIPILGVNAVDMQ